VTAGRPSKAGRVFQGAGKRRYDVYQRRGSNGGDVTDEGKGKLERPGRLKVWGHQVQPGDLGMPFQWADTMQRGGQGRECAQK